MRTKTYVLILSTHFPKGHPREGEETGFAGNAIAGLDYGGQPTDWHVPPVKLHTIRENYGLWKYRIDEVNAGRAVLSVREWLGETIRSKQRELFRLDRDSGIGVERLELSDRFNPCVYDCHGSLTVVRDESFLAANDGLTHEDWRAWFRDCDRTQPMAIIHFTNFRYCK